MKLIHLSKELILSACKDEIAKSRYFKSSFINKASGHKMPIKDVATFIKLHTLAHVRKHYEGHLATTVKGHFHANPIFIDSLDDFDYLNSEELKGLNFLIPEWTFFENILKIQGWNYSTVLCMPMYRFYCENFGHRSHKAFYQELKFWAAENGVKLTFKNTRKSRKVIAEW